VDSVKRVLFRLHPLDHLQKSRPRKVSFKNGDISVKVMWLPSRLGETKQGRGKAKRLKFQVSWMHLNPEKEQSSL
jgi:hypothetical protein